MKICYLIDDGSEDKKANKNCLEATKKKNKIENIENKISRKKKQN